MRRILLSILLSLLASSSFAGGPGLLFTAGGSPPTTPVITATPGDTTNTITMVSGDVGALTNVLYWDTTSRATYDLYANSISNATLVAASFPGTPYVHTGRTNGTPYYYMLRGTDVAGSTSSAQVSGTPTGGQAAAYFGATDTTGATEDTASGMLSYNYGAIYTCPGTGTRTIDSLEYYAKSAGVGNNCFRMALGTVASPSTILFQGSTCTYVTGTTLAWQQQTTFTGTPQCTGGTNYIIFAVQSAGTDLVQGYLLDSTGSNFKYQFSSDGLATGGFAGTQATTGTAGDVFHPLFRAHVTAE